MYAGSIARLPRWAVIKRARRRQRRRIMRRAMVLAVLAVIGVGLLTQHSDAGPQRAYASVPTRLAAAEVGGLGGSVLGAQRAGAHVWVLTCVQHCGATNTGLDSERLVEVSASSGAVIRRLPAFTNVVAFTTMGRDLWVAHSLSGQVARIDPANGRVTAELTLRLPVPVAPGAHQFLPSALSSAGGFVWASSWRGWIAQIDAHTGKLVRMVRTPSENNQTTINRYGMWVAEDLDGLGFLAPHKTHLAIRTPMQAGLPLEVSRVFSAGRVVWALASTNDFFSTTKAMLLEVNAPTDRVIRRVRVPVSSGQDGVVAGGALYLGDLAHGRIYRVSRNGALRTFGTSRHDAWLATASPGALWAAFSVTPGHRGGRMLKITLPRG